MAYTDSFTFTLGKKQTKNINEQKFDVFAQVLSAQYYCITDYLEHTVVLFYAVQLAAVISRLVKSL